MRDGRLIGANTFCRLAGRTFRDVTTAMFQLNPKRRFVSLLVGLSLISALQAESFRWDRSGGSLSLRNGDATVWALKIQKGDCKPCIHPLNTVDGFELSDYRPADHIWHTALWFCFKLINNRNYWEENRETLLSDGRTKVIDYQITTREDFSALIRMTLSYHLPDQADLLTEKRQIHVSSPNEDGSYSMDWRHSFKAKEKVVLGRTPRIGEPNGVAHGGYAGMSLRLNKQTLKWKFLDSEGRQDSHGKRARWMSFSGHTTQGDASVSIFDHPSNPRFPNYWFVVPNMPYFSPAFLFENSMVLDAGEDLDLIYRIKVHSRLPGIENIEKEFRDFSSDYPKTAARSTEGANRRIDLVELGKTIATNYACVECHSITKEPELGKQGSGWFGLIGKKTSEKNVIQQGEETRVRVDEAYIRRSILEPTAQMAIREHEPQKGTPFLPIMPPYPMLKPLEIDGVIAYMKTLNEAPNRGPLTVWRQNEIQAVDTRDPHKIVVEDQPLVYRVAMKDVSTRAISVGLPWGYNYIFDPCTFSVRKAWNGGFINLAKERTGRGRGFNDVNRINHELILSRECLAPLGLSGPIDLSYKDYLNDRDWQLKRFQEDLKNPKPFLEQAPDGDYQFLGYLRLKNQPPVFQFRIDGVEYDQQLVFESDEVFHYHFKTRGATAPIRFQVLEDRVESVQSSHGVLKDGLLEISARDAGNFSVSVRLRRKAPKHPSGPAMLTRLAIASSPGTPDGNGGDAMAAIDENIETYWDETNDLKEYSLELSLPFEKRMNTLILMGWRHQNFAPRDFQVLVDGQVVKTVQDAQYKNNLLTVRFDPVEGKVIQLKITGYYGRSPAIRELKVFLQ